MTDAGRAAAAGETGGSCGAAARAGSLADAQPRTPDAAELQRQQRRAAAARAAADVRHAAAGAAEAEADAAATAERQAAAVAGYLKELGQQLQLFLLQSMEAGGDGGGDAPETTLCRSSDARTLQGAERLAAAWASRTCTAALDTVSSLHENDVMAITGGKGDAARALCRSVCSRLRH